MSEFQDMISDMMGPVEFYGGPLDGRIEEAFIAPYIILPYQKGRYVLDERMIEGRQVYKWKEARR